ncbi:FtsB family cell division protein [Azospirillum picis]|uniref:Cell division protein FtsB n=1 Tax=Azospirillum picis TaxID=488438 RepID=A0ABU0MGJ1_9PROT|nr:septum formation initiator family protein [Azospirillum picis]MBP2298432.1 cell division protein FtsB [Azospirillum picis]MDQ0532519.1 cell division protein FtsB [Azospirillum picis]
MTMIADLTDTLARAAKSAIRQAIMPALCACVVAYFAYYAIHGDRGLVAKKHMQDEIGQAQEVLSQLRTQREDMERRAQLLRGDGLDRDMLEERARQMLNFSNPRDVIVKLPKLADPQAESTEKQGKPAN